MKSLIMQSLLLFCSLAKLCLTLVTPWTAAHQAPLVHGILQANILEWGHHSLLCRIFPPRDGSMDLLRCRQEIFTIWATMETPVSRSLLRFMSTKSIMLPNHFILCHPLLLPSIILSTKVFSGTRVFSNGSALCIRWPWRLSRESSPSPQLESINSSVLSFYG